MSKKRSRRLSESVEGKKESITITFKLPVTILKMFDEIAKAEKANRSKIIRKALLLYIYQRDKDCIDKKLQDIFDQIS